MQVLWNKNKADSYKSRPSYFMKMFPGDSNSGVKIKYRCFLFSVNIWLPRKKIQRSASNGVFINSFWRILYSTSLKKKKKVFFVVWTSFLRLQLNFSKLWTQSQTDDTAVVVLTPWLSSVLSTSPHEVQDKPEDPALCVFSVLIG